MTMDMTRYKTVQISYVSGQARLLLVSEDELEQLIEAGLSGKTAVRLGDLGVISLQGFRFVQCLESTEGRAKTEKYWLDQAKKRGAEDEQSGARKLVDLVRGKREDTT